jgi:YVTN family beta-propeller protein
MAARKAFYLWKLSITVVFVFLVVANQIAVVGVEMKEGVEERGAGDFSYGGISVIDTATDQVTSGISASCPVAMAITPAGTKAYVVRRYCILGHTPLPKGFIRYGTVSVADTATNQVTAIIPVGVDPVAVKITPAGTKVYVSNWGNDTVSVIDTAMSQVIATVSVGRNPGSMVVTPDGTKVYVMNNGSGTVSVIDTKINQVIATIFVGVEVRKPGFNLEVVIATV